MRTESASESDSLPPLELGDGPTDPKAAARAAAVFAAPPRYADGPTRPMPAAPPQAAAIVAIAMWWRSMWLWARTPIGAAKVAAYVAARDAVPELGEIALVPVYDATAPVRLVPYTHDRNNRRVQGRLGLVTPWAGYDMPTALKALVPAAAWDKVGPCIPGNCKGVWHFAADQLPAVQQVVTRFFPQAPALVVPPSVTPLATAAVAAAPNTRQLIATLRVPSPAPAVSSAMTDGPVSAQAKSLAEAEHALAAEHDLGVKGAVDDGLFFTAGTELWGIGQENLKAYAAAYQAMPTLAAAAQSHRAVLATEQRTETVVSLPEWRVDANGALRHVNIDGVRPAPDTGSIAVSAHAYSQIQGFYPHDRALSRGRAAMRSTDAQDRATVKRAKWPAGKPLPAAPGNINGWIGDLADIKTKDGKPQQHRFRSRDHRGQREVFAVFPKSSRGYVAFDTDRLLAEAAKVQPGLRVDLKYDADTTRMRARVIAQAPIDIPAFVGVGRVHQIGFDLRSADDGSMSLQCQPFLIRVRCKNASLVQTEGRRRTFRHVGTFKTLEENIVSALEHAGKAIEPMKALWTRAAAEHFLDSESGAALSVPEAITRLINGEYLPTGGLDPDEAHAAYMSAWRAEDSPSSAMGIIMAVQRAAHESSWSTKWAQDEVEEAASDLLYQSVYTLDAPETAEA